MGNNLGVGGCIEDDGSFHLQLGRSATVDITEKHVLAMSSLVRDRDGTEFANYVKKETREASYKVDGLTCALHLTKRTSRYAKQQEQISFVARIDDDLLPSGGFEITIFLSESGLSDKLKVSLASPTKTSVISHRWGGVTETRVFLYGSGSRGGLIVVERKRRGGDKKAYRMTVAHYYAASTGEFFSKTKTDVGISMVAKIEMLNDHSQGFDLKSVEGPVRHPAAALFYMFQDVSRTGIWKPTSCPHCAHYTHKQRSGMFPPSESEDSDNNNVSATIPNNSQGQNACVLGNNGVFRGNHNGNIFTRYFNVRR